VFHGAVFLLVGHLDGAPAGQTKSPKPCSYRALWIILNDLESILGSLSIELSIKAPWLSGFCFFDFSNTVKNTVKL